MILAGLAVFSGLSLNLVLQFALGSGPAGKTRKVPLYQIACLFLSVILLWIIYARILKFVSWELMAFFLLFPLSALVCYGFEFLEKFLFPDREPVRLFSSITAYEGLVPASLILTINIAVTLSDALILSLFFAAGSLLAVVFMKEIRRRASLEEVPENLRGMPLAFISMGLLSLVFSAAALICYRVL